MMGVGGDGFGFAQFKAILSVMDETILTFRSGAAGG
jgi:hypothetical protein